MNWESIALATATVLLPYLTKAGEAAAQKIGQDVYSWLKGHFQAKNDQDALGAVTALENDPQSKARLSVLSETIEKRAKADPENFGAELSKLVERLKNESGSVGHTVKVTINTINARDVGTINQGNNY